MHMSSLSFSQAEKPFVKMAKEFYNASVTQCVFMLKATENWFPLETFQQFNLAYLQIPFSTFHCEMCVSCGRDEVKENEFSKRSEAKRIKVMVKPEHMKQQITLWHTQQQFLAAFFL